jgi:hypothetical protein
MSAAPDVAAGPFVISRPSGGVSASAQIRQWLCSNYSRVIDLFHDWDDDGSGTIDQREFRQAMPLLGLDAPRVALDELFRSWDFDRSGSIAIHEFHALLRPGGADDGGATAARVARESEPAKEGPYKGGHHPTNSKRNESKLLKLDIDEASEMTYADQIRAALAQNAVRGRAPEPARLRSRARRPTVSSCGRCAWWTCSASGTRTARARCPRRSSARRCRSWASTRPRRRST